MHALAQSRSATSAALQANDLTGLGLTAREAEILLWIAQGKRDAENVERILAKLCIETRGAAVAAGLSMKKEF